MQRLVCGFALFVSLAVPTAARADELGDLADALRGLSTQVLPADQRDAASGLVRQDLRKRIQAANDRSSQAWRKIKNRDDWERFRDPHLKALQQSLGRFPDPPKKLNVRVTGRLNGDGFTIENLVYESRPGLWVTANLYVPSPLRESMPGILLSHAHHRPKEQGELQDMGMTWARKGCLVLVPDHLGHGERRQHPFASAKDYAGEFRVSRQDYYFRYDTGMQLHLVGDSLMGWMVWDLMRGVDLLLQRKGIDPKRIALLGAVAGGGDPAGVTAALDKRIAAAVPFNFGGPQPETVYKLPADAETSFNYAGSGSWESTRNLYRSAADGFLHWVIVGGIAPRGLIYAHEFAWDEPRDPVWKRFQQIYGFYDRRDFLASTHGRGGVRGRPPESTHCTNIGREHRKMIHAAFEKWFGITGLPQDEFSRPRDSSELRCMTAEAEMQLKPKRLVDLLPILADERIAAARKRLAGKTLSDRRRMLQSEWASVLGSVKPQATTKLPYDCRRGDGKHLN